MYCSLFLNYLFKSFNDLNDFVNGNLFQEGQYHASCIPRGGKVEAQNPVKYISLDPAADFGLEGSATSYPKKHEGKSSHAKGSAGKGKKSSQPHNTIAVLIRKKPSQSNMCKCH